MCEFDGNRLTRPPRGFSADSPALDLLLCRQWGVSATLPAERATRAALLRDIIRDSLWQLPSSTSSTVRLLQPGLQKSRDILENPHTFPHMCQKSDKTQKNGKIYMETHKTH